MAWKMKAKALRERRLEKMWSVEELEKASGVSARTIFDLEKQDRVVRTRTLSDLAQALASPPNSLARLVDDEEEKRKAPSAPAPPPEAPAPNADARVPAPLPPLRAYGPGLTELPRLTRLEELVAIEATLPPRPPRETPDGPVPALTAKLYQDIFTAYRVHEGRVAYVHGVVLAQRGMGHEQASICGTKSGMGARFHFVFDVSPGHEIGVTVHTAFAKETAGLQDRLNRTAVAIVKVVVAPDEAVARGGGFEFFMSNAKTLRPWGLEVVAVLAADPEVVAAPPAAAEKPAAGTGKSAAKPAAKPKKTARSAKR